MTQERKTTQLVIGYDPAGNPITYQHISFKSRGIALSAATTNKKTHGNIGKIHTLEMRMKQSHTIQINRQRKSRMKYTRLTSSKRDKTGRFI